MPFEPKIVQSDDSSSRSFAASDALRMDDAALVEGLALPDELEFLAEQLRDDSLYLAESYPAGTPKEIAVAASPETTKPPRTAPRRLRYAMIAAAASVAFFIAGGFYSYWSMQSGNQAAPINHGSLAGVAPSDTDAHPTALGLNDQEPKVQAAVAKTLSPLVPTSIEKNATVPVGQSFVSMDASQDKTSASLTMPPDSVPVDFFLQEVSGPELEGMLDLLEREAPAGTRLSL